MANHNLISLRPFNQATTSGLGGGSSSKLAGGLAEQARIAEGQRVAVETGLRQLEMREQHLLKEVASGEKKLSAMETKSGGRCSEEVKKQRQLNEQMEKLKAQLDEIRLADEEAGGDEAAITSELAGCFFLNDQWIVLNSTSI